MVEITVLMPCLNEAETIQRCICNAQQSFKRLGMIGEVVIADNGSSDASQELARAAGARVIEVKERGYGAALQAGICASRGRYVIMGDADDSYDFSQLDGFITKMREGYQLVIGNRFQGGIRPKAMPWLHRYIGNPVLSFLGRLFFRIGIGDFHCGLRAFERRAVLKLGLSTSGMEFASEMVVKAALAGLRIAEVPTTLRKDGRSRAPHLRTWRDGWRHLRFLLIFSPRWLFLYPGLALAATGVGLQASIFHGALRIGAIGLDIHTMLYSAAMSVIGMQMVWFAIFAKVYGTSVGLLPPHYRLEQALRSLTLERGLAIGFVMLSGGLFLSGNAIHEWARLDYGALDPRAVMRIAIPSVSMMLMGTEIILGSFFLGLLSLKHHTPSEITTSADNSTYNPPIESPADAR